MTKSVNWERAVNFHGHACPGLAYGVRAAEIALERLGASHAPDEEMVAIVETDACSADGIQAVTGCSFGKGNFFFKDHGKQAFTFILRESGKAIRIVMQPDRSKMPEDREEKIKYILEAPESVLCKVEEVKTELPPKARIFQSLQCENCGEYFMEPRGRIQDGKIVCLACYKPYQPISY